MLDFNRFFLLIRYTITIKFAMFKKSTGILKVFLLVAMVVIAAQCKNKSSDKKPLLPPVTGKPGDITLVISNNHWEGVAGDTLKSVFYEEIYGLPNIEPLYDLMQVPHKAFSNLYKKTRNILLVKISESYDTASIVVQKDLWAKPQLVMSVVAKTPEEAANIIHEKQERIVSVFNDIERKRYKDMYQNSQDNGLKLKIEQKHQIYMVVPNGYKMGMDSTNFTWIDHLQADNITQGFFIYEYPYTDTNTFTREFLVEKRNEILQKYVQGSVKGSYMTTEALLPPAFAEYVLNKETYVAEIRGLWKMAEGDIMGGPFVSYTLHDESRNRVVTVEGYVFAPGHKKRNLVRQMEAILTTLKIKPANDTGN